MRGRTARRLPQSSLRINPYQRTSVSTTVSLEPGGPRAICPRDGAGGSLLPMNNCSERMEINLKNITLERALCKGCGICIALCPKNVFDADIEGKPLTARADACIGCKLCQYRCPDFALKVEE